MCTFNSIQSRIISYTTGAAKILVIHPLCHGWHKPQTNRQSLPWASIEVRTIHLGCCGQEEHWFRGIWWVLQSQSGNPLSIIWVGPHRWAQMCMVQHGGRKVEVWVGPTQPKPSWLDLSELSCWGWGWEQHSCAGGARTSSGGAPWGNHSPSSGSGHCDQCSITTSPLLSSSNIYTWQLLPSLIVYHTPLHLLFCILNVQRRKNKGP